TSEPPPAARSRRPPGPALRQMSSAGIWFSYVLLVASRRLHASSFRLQVAGHILRLAACSLSLCHGVIGSRLPCDARLAACYPVPLSLGSVSSVCFVGAGSPPFANSRLRPISR